MKDGGDVLRAIDAVVGESAQLTTRVRVDRLLEAGVAPGLGRSSWRMTYADMAPFYGCSCSYCEQPSEVVCINGLNATGPCLTLTANDRSVLEDPPDGVAPDLIMPYPGYGSQPRIPVEEFLAPLLLQEDFAVRMQLHPHCEIASAATWEVMTDGADDRALRPPESDR